MNEFFMKKCIKRSRKLYIRDYTVFSKNLTFKNLMLEGPLTDHFQGVENSSYPLLSTKRVQKHELKQTPFSLKVKIFQFPEKEITVIADQSKTMRCLQRNGSCNVRVIHSAFLPTNTGHSSFTNKIRNCYELDESMIWGYSPQVGCCTPHCLVFILS